MNKNIKVSNVQIRGLIVSAAIGVGVLSLPNTLANTLQNNGWIAIIFSGLLIIPVMAVITRIFLMYPDKDIFQIGNETLGPVFFTICLLFVAAYFIVFSAIVSRILGELIKAFLLPITPLEVIVFIFILTTSYITSFEIDAIVRTGFFVYPIIIFFTLLIVFVSLPNADFSNLLPIYNVKLKNISMGIRDAYFSFAGFEMTIFALPYVEDKKKTFKSSVYAIIIVTLVYFALYVMSVSHFSIEQLKRQQFPVLQLVKQVDLPGFFIENLDGLVMAIWVIVVFATLAPAYFSAGKTISKILRVKNHKYIIWILVPIIYKVSLIPESLVVVQKRNAMYFNVLGFISVVIIPILILVVGTIRKKAKR